VASRVTSFRSLSTKSLLILSCLALALPSAGAWSNGGYSADPNNPDYGTHDWIAEKALAIQTRDVTFLSSTYHSLFLLGTEAPDNPDYIGDTSNHHIYFYSTRELQDDACAVRASSIYQTALGYLVDGKYDDAAYDIGVMAHYLADPGVFGHTMGAYTDWGAEVHHSDYENEFESRLSSLPAPSGISLGDLDARTAALGLAEATTFGDGAIQSNVWMDTNYDWSNGVFEASAMASLYASVETVAAVINHLLTEAASSELPPSPQVPQPPASLSASVEGSQVVLAWTAPPSDGGSSITGYMLHRGTDPENHSLLTTVAGNTFTWTDGSVEKGKTYYYWVAAVNSVGSSDMVRIASVTVPRDSGSLLVPILLSAVSAAIASGGVILWRRRRRDGRPR
jgi:hypothetical protein